MPKNVCESCLLSAKNAVNSCKTLRPTWIPLTIMEWRERVYTQRLNKGKRGPSGRPPNHLKGGYRQLGSGQRERLRSQLMFLVLPCSNCSVPMDAEQVLGIRTAAPDAGAGGGRTTRPPLGRVQRIPAVGGAAPGTGRLDSDTPFPAADRWNVRSARLPDPGEPQLLCPCFRIARPGKCDNH
jgi:hypothetical protein